MKVKDRFILGEGVQEEFYTIYYEFEDGCFANSCRYFGMKDI